MQFALELDKLLHEKYSQKDPYFDPPESTIEPTKKDRNVDAVNIIPGEDITYFDCRILPTYNLDEVITNINNLAREYENKTGATIEITITSKNLAPKPTDANAKIVTMLKGAIKTVRQVQPKIGGIGGGTCAAYFRKANLPAVVWSTIDETAHQPNEYAKIDNIVNDARVYALIMTT
jgi:succinyl-diaminopimelate desuccinylase